MEDDRITKGSEGLYMSVDNSSVKKFHQKLGLRVWHLASILLVFCTKFQPGSSRLSLVLLYSMAILVRIWRMYQHKDTILGKYGRSESIKHLLHLRKMIQAANMSSQSRKPWSNNTANSSLQKKSCSFFFATCHLFRGNLAEDNTQDLERIAYTNFTIYTSLMSGRMSINYSIMTGKLFSDPLETLSSFKMTCLTLKFILAC